MKVAKLSVTITMMKSKRQIEDARLYCAIINKSVFSSTWRNIFEIVDSATHVIKILILVIVSVMDEFMCVNIKM